MWRRSGDTRSGTSRSRWTSSSGRRTSTSSKRRGAARSDSSPVAFATGSSAVSRYAPTVPLVLGTPSDCYYERMAERVRGSFEGVGEFIRSQRRLARLSLRQLSDKAKVSNPYLSQIERGIYKPSAEVLKGIAEALNISAESLYARIGLVDPEREGVQRPPSVEEAVRLDGRLTTRQKETLLSVYRDF